MAAPMMGAVNTGGGTAMFKRIDHIALHVADLEKSSDFYRRNFGFEHYFEHEGGGGQRIAYLRLGGTVLELTHRSDGAMAGFHFCLEASDFDAAVLMLEKNGVETVRAAHPTAAREPREDGWRRAVFLGPDGEQIEIRG